MEWDWGLILCRGRDGMIKLRWMMIVSRIYNQGKHTWVPMPYLRNVNCWGNMDANLRLNMPLGRYETRLFRWWRAVNMRWILTYVSRFEEWERVNVHVSLTFNIMYRKGWEVKQVISSHVKVMCNKNKCICPDIRCVTLYNVRDLCMEFFLSS